MAKEIPSNCESVGNTLNLKCIPCYVYHYNASKLYSNFHYMSVRNITLLRCAYCEPLTL